MALSNNNLIWIDLEMTGLIPEKDRIIEIATVITDANLVVIDQGPALAIHQSEAQLATMDEWNQQHHNNSGLIDRVKASVVTEAEAEQQTLAFIQQYVPQGQSPMCGNSICTDRRFLYRYMPTLQSYFHYRNLDVSTLKILAQQWAPDVAAAVNKVSDHRALNDIHDSIAELRYYRQHLFKQ